MKRVVIVGGGFAGLNAAKIFGGRKDIEVTVLDRRNHHLFQPLLYQVAMAGLSPAEIAQPIRSILAGHANIRVLQGEAMAVDFANNRLKTDFGDLPYDYLVLACGATHSYFGHPEWAEFAPGLKTIANATAIRRRVLLSYEQAEREDDAEKRRALMTFIVVGGGPTGVELAGALGEMSRFTLARDFRKIDSKQARIILLEAGPRILPSFNAKLAACAKTNLEKMGVQVWCGSAVTGMDEHGVTLGSERIAAATIVWAAGVQAARLNNAMDVARDRVGKVIVNPDLSVGEHRNVFVVGDQASFAHGQDRPLPGTAPVAMQQGRHVAKVILADMAGRTREAFRFSDKGQMATIGRSHAIVQIGSMNITGVLAWLIWLAVHIYYLTGFKNRLIVVSNWGWSYLTMGRGARLIVDANE